MTKYYADSEEKYLKGVMLYVIQATGGKSFGLFYDAEGTKQAHKSDYDWEDLFLKGLIRVRNMSENVGSSISLCVPYKLFADGNGIHLVFGPGIGSVADFFPDPDPEDSVFPGSPAEPGK